MTTKYIVGSYASIKEAEALRKVHLKDRLNKTGSIDSGRAQREDGECTRNGCMPRNVLTSKVIDLYNSKGPSDREFFLWRIGLGHITSVGTPNTLHPIGHQTAPDIDGIVSAYMKHLAK